MKNNISITEQDYIKLCDLVKVEKMKHTTEMNNIAYLGSEIKRAKRIKENQSINGLITMNSVVEVVDLDTGREMRVKLVYPGEADFRKGNVSILSMFGSALLGYKVGSTVSYMAPGGIKKVRIQNVHQPETVQLISK